MFKHILVPTDGSSLSDLAVRKAVSIAKSTQARITFFFAAPDEASELFNRDAELTRNMNPQEFEDSINRQIRNVLGRAEAIAREEAVASDTLSAVSNYPFEAIIEAAKKSGCDLILMASHGRRGVKGLLLGSQTQKVLTHSTIPVLVYR